MLLLGLLLLVAAGVLTGGMLVDNKSDYRADVFGYHLPHLTIGQLFLVGVGAGVVATLGLVLLLAGMRRSGRRRRAQRVELKGKRQREEELKEENARLARELEQQRYSAPPAGGATSLDERAADAPGGQVPPRTAAEERAAAAPAANDDPRNPRR